MSENANDPFEITSKDDLILWGKVLEKLGWIPASQWDQLGHTYAQMVRNLQLRDPAGSSQPFCINDFLVQYGLLSPEQCQSVINIVSKVHQQQWQNASPPSTQVHQHPAYGQQVVELIDDDDRVMVLGKAGHPESSKHSDYVTPEEEMIELVDEAEQPVTSKTRHPDAVRLSEEARKELISQGEIEQLELADEDDDPAGVRKKDTDDASKQPKKFDYGPYSPMSLSGSRELGDELTADLSSFEDFSDDAPLELNLAPDDDRLDGYQGKMSAVDWVESNESEGNDYIRNEADQIPLEDED